MNTVWLLYGNQVDSFCAFNNTQNDPEYAETFSVKLREAIEKEGFAVGAEVDISEGPFAGFVGVIDKIDYENERLTVMVSIFGRLTPVELGFDQVKK